MKKHKFNYLPDANDHDFQGILESIKARGFDTKQPITLYQGDVLDGWQRQRACDELEINPTYKDFTGTDLDALDFVRMMAERRNLNSGQKAACAAEAQDLMEQIADAVDKGRREKMAGNQNASKKQEDKNLSDRYDSNGLLIHKTHPEHPDYEKNMKRMDEHATKTATKLAESFGTNRTYVNQARKIKEAAPEIAEKVKAGKMTHQDAMKAVRAIPIDPWSDDEKERKAQVEAGESVVANFQRDKNLIQWASENGKMLAIDRSSKWGNPFVMGPDGDRDTVCDCFEKYAVLKLSFEKSKEETKGKVLCCHCYPERCHGETIIALFSRQP